MVRFPTTSWSIVTTAGNYSAEQQSAALAELCQAYWSPVHEYILGQGYEIEDALDLTQEFFARLIEKNYSFQADRERGRFRSFLLGTLKHFLASETRRGHAQKRGGGQQPLPLACDAPEADHKFELLDEATPERLFERRWAVTVIDRALDGLRGTTHFDQLKQFLTGGEVAGGYSAVAAKLGLSEGAVKVKVHRLRRRFGEQLRAEIGRTVESPAEIDEELRHLLRAVSVLR